MNDVVVVGVENRIGRMCAGVMSSFSSLVSFRSSCVFLPRQSHKVLPER